MSASGQLITITSLPMFFLSNLSWQAEATPELLVRIAQMLPSTPGINAMVELNQMIASMPEVSAKLANLAILALLYGSLAMCRYRPGVPGQKPQQEHDDTTNDH